VEIYLRREACHYKIEEKNNSACRCLQATGPLLIFTLYAVLQVDSAPLSPPVQSTGYHKGYIFMVNLCVHISAFFCFYLRNRSGISGRYITKSEIHRVGFLLGLGHLWNGVCFALISSSLTCFQIGLNSMICYQIRLSSPIGISDPIEFYEWQHRQLTQAAVVLMIGNFKSPPLMDLHFISYMQLCLRYKSLRNVLAFC